MKCRNIQIGRYTKFIFFIQYSINIMPVKHSRFVTVVADVGARSQLHLTALERGVTNDKDFSDCEVILHIVQLYCFFIPEELLWSSEHIKAWRSSPSSLLQALVTFAHLSWKLVMSVGFSLFTSTLDFRCKPSWRKWRQSLKCRANTRRGWRAAAGRWNAHLASPARDYRSAQI